jgi:hypothetical protein
MTTAWRGAGAAHERQMIGAGTKRLLVHCCGIGGEFEEGLDMRKLGLAAVVAASMAATGCATAPNQYGYDPYGYNNGYNSGYGYNQPYYNNGTAGRAATGAAIGAVGGAIGATVNGRQYYRDTRGYCYYVDQYGQPHYDYNTRC